MEPPQFVIVLARAVYYVALVVLFGASVFPVYAGRGARVVQPRWLMTALAAAIWLALVTWLVAFAISLSDPGEAPATVKIVLFESSFGTVWLVRLGTSFVLLLAVLAVSQTVIAVVLAAVLLICEGWGGHAVAWGTLGSLNLALHVLCAAVWLGSLLPLSQVVGAACCARVELQVAETALRQFSVVAVSAVMGVVVTGAINTGHMIGKAPNSTDSYVRVLTFKIMLVLVMLGLAAANRYRFLPKLQGEGQMAALRSLSVSVAIEQIVGFLVLLDVSALGMIDPHS